VRLPPLFIGRSRLPSIWVGDPGNLGTDGTFPDLSALPVEGDLLLPGISDGRLRAASLLRSKKAMGGRCKSCNEFR